MKSGFLEVAFFILHAIKCQFPSLKNNPCRGSLRTLEDSREKIGLLKNKSFNIPRKSVQHHRQISCKSTLGNCPLP
ncbi:MAG: hypothetical protein J6V54_09850 [Bacteroidales bacterium]|nr:hypothetical protein [Bacteroidales bacterium]